MEELLEMEEETLNQDDKLENLGLDSLVILALIAMIDENYESSLATDDISSCVTIDDLAIIVEKAAKS